MRAFTLSTMHDWYLAYIVWKYHARIPVLTWRADHADNLPVGLAAKGAYRDELADSFFDVLPCMTDI